MNILLSIIVTIIRLAFLITASVSACFISIAIIDLYVSFDKGVWPLSPSKEYPIVMFIGHVLTSPDLLVYFLLSQKAIKQQAPLFSFVKTALLVGTINGLIAAIVLLFTFISKNHLLGFLFLVVLIIATASMTGLIYGTLINIRILCKSVVFC